MTPERVSLRNGRVIGSPLERLVEFAELDGTYQYQGYDQISPEPFELNALDVRLANRIIARMGTDVCARILAQSGEVAAALRRVPADATLAVPADRVDWDALYGLYRSLSGLPAVGVPRMTKVLHRKRPALVPILDEVVRSYLSEVEPLVLTGSAADKALTLTVAYHREAPPACRVHPAPRCARRSRRPANRVPDPRHPPVGLLRHLHPAMAAPRGRRSPSLSGASPPTVRRSCAGSGCPPP